MLSMSRFEHKYRVREELAAEIQDFARFHVSPDEHSRDGSYLVNSLYFDTPRNDDAHETDDGIALRSKVRLRCYSRNPRPPVVLELKFFGAAPRWMQRIAHDFELQRTSCSKYGMSLFSLERSPMNFDLAQAS